MKNKLPVPFVLSNHNGKWLKKEQIRFRFSGKHVYGEQIEISRLKKVDFQWFSFSIVLRNKMLWVLYY